MTWLPLAASSRSVASLMGHCTSCSHRFCRRPAWMTDSLLACGHTGSCVPITRRALFPGPDSSLRRREQKAWQWRPRNGLLQTGDTASGEKRHAAHTSLHRQPASLPTWASRQAGPAPWAVSFDGVLHLDWHPLLCTCLEHDAPLLSPTDLSDSYIAKRPRLH